MRTEDSFHHLGATDSHEKHSPDESKISENNDQYKVPPTSIWHLEILLSRSHISHNPDDLACYLGTCPLTNTKNLNKSC